MIRTILSLAALIAFAGRVSADDAKCCKDGAKDKVTISAKEGVCPEKAQLIAAKVLAESCPVASAAILATELPQITCEKARAKLVADIKAGNCKVKGGQAIITALASFQGAAAEKTATTAKEGDCCDKEKPATTATVSLCAEKAQLIAAKVLAESCPDASAKILADEVPGITCEKARAKLVIDIKAGNCKVKGGEAIITALASFQGATAEKEVGQILASAREALSGLKACDVESARAILAAIQKAAKSEKSGAVTTTTTAKASGSCCEGKAKSETTTAVASSALCATKAKAFAVRIRTESCPDKSAEILAEALPTLKCKETLAKLVTEIKAKGCEDSAAAVILAAQEDLSKAASKSAQ